MDVVLNEGGFVAAGYGIYLSIENGHNHPPPPHNVLDASVVGNVSVA